jgi:hypothetical protein
MNMMRRVLLLSVCALVAHSVVVAQPKAAIDLDGLRIGTSLKQVEQLLRASDWSDTLQPEVESDAPLAYVIGPSQLVLMSPKPLVGPMVRDVVVMFDRDTLAQMMLNSAFLRDREHAALEKALAATLKEATKLFGAPTGTAVAPREAVRSLRANKDPLRFVGVATWEIKGAQPATVELFLVRDPNPPRSRGDGAGEANMVMLNIYDNARMERMQQELR